MEIHHIAFRTRELARLEAFYREGLGLEVVRRRNGQSVWLALGARAVLMLEQADPGEPLVPSGTLELIALTVSDPGRASVRRRLEEHGVAVEDETEHTTYFRDPDGRRVAVSTHPLTT